MGLRLSKAVSVALIRSSCLPADATGITRLMRPPRALFDTYISAKNARLNSVQPFAESTIGRSASSDQRRLMFFQAER